MENLLALTGVAGINFEPATKDQLNNGTEIKIKNQVIGYLGEVNEKTLKQFDIKQPVFYADLFWDEILSITSQHKIEYREISKFPAVTRDLSVVVDKNVTYTKIEKAAASLKIESLKSVQLFDIFESDKLGEGKKAMAISYTFLPEAKTLTDIEIDSFMQKIIAVSEKELGATIRK